MNLRRLSCSPSLSARIFFVRSFSLPAAAAGAGRKRAARRRRTSNSISGRAMHCCNTGRTRRTAASERASEGAREGGKAASQKSKKPRDGHEINRQLWGRMRGREGTERWPAHRRLCLSVCLRSLSCNGDGEDWLAIHFPIPLSHGSG